MNRNKLNQTILLLGLMLFFLQGDNYATAPVIVDLMAEFNLPLSKGVWTVTAYMIPFGIFTLLFGPLGDRIGKSRLLKSAAILTGLFSLASAFMPNFALVCLVRVLNGVFAAAVMPVSMALIGDLSDGDMAQHQKAVAKTMGLMFLGGAVGPIIGGWISHLGSWRAVYGLYGAIELILAMIIFFSLHVPEKKTQAQSFLTVYRQALIRPGVLRTVLLVFLVGFSVLGIFPFMGKYAENLFDLDLDRIGLLLTCFGLGTLLGGRMTLPLFKKSGQLVFLLAGITGAGSLALVMNLKNQPTLFALGLLGFGFSFMLIQPILVTRVQQLLPTHKGTAMSLVSLNMATGGGLGAFLYGVILNRGDYITILTLSALIFACAALLGWMVFSRKIAMA